MNSPLSSHSQLQDSPLYRTIPFDGNISSLNKPPSPTSTLIQGNTPDEHTPFTTDSQHNTVRAHVPSSPPYSFVVYIASFGVYFCFIFWAYLPPEVLHYLGITYYPSRYYAIALPAFILVTVCAINLSYIAYNMLKTHDPDEFSTFRDDLSAEGAVKTARCPARFMKYNDRERIPDIADIDPIELSKVLWR